MILDPQSDEQILDLWDAADCRRCAGSGFADCIGDLDSERLCPVCRGSGLAPEEKP